MSKEFERVRRSSPDVQIGKNGLTDGIVSHMEELLKDKYTIKIKVLKSIAQHVSMKEVLEEVLKKLSVHVMDVRGHTAILSIWKNTEGVNYPKKYRKMRQRIDQELAKAKPQGEDFIDYDNEELVEEIDARAEDFYNMGSNENEKEQ